MGEVQAAYDAASAAHAAGDHERAIRLYRAAVRSDPEPPVVDVELFVAEMLIGLGREPEAVQAYRTVIAHDPQSEEAWRRMGETLLRLGNEHDGRAALRRAETLREHLALGGSADTALVRLATADDPEERARLLSGLVAIAHPRIDEAFAAFLTRADGIDMATCSHDVCAALVDALVGVGMQDFAGIYSDGNAPDRDLIARDLHRYLARRTTGSDRERASWLRRSFGRRARGGPRGS